MTEVQMRIMMLETAELAAQKVLVATGQLKPHLSLKEAQCIHGKSIVNRWIKEGLVRPIKDGEGNTKVRIDRIQLEAVARTSNRASWFEHNK
jgi:hypothetical protein